MAIVWRRGFNKTARPALHWLEALVLKAGVVESAEREFPLLFALIFRLDDFPMGVQLAVGNRRGQLGFFRTTTRESDRKSQRSKKVRRNMTVHGSASLYLPKRLVASVLSGKLLADGNGFSDSHRGSLRRPQHFFPGSLRPARNT